MDPLRRHRPLRSLPPPSPLARTLVAVVVASTAGAPGALARGRDALPPGSPPPVLSGQLRRPVPGSGAPLRAFAPGHHRWDSGHRGVDLAAGPGRTVVAPAAGTVRFAGRVAGRPVLSIDHGGEVVTTYEPVESTLRAGTVVAAGQAVGVLLAGHPGCPEVTCLHWGAMVGGAYVDPMALLLPGERPIRLLPLHPGDTDRWT